VDCDLSVVVAAFRSVIDNLKGLRNEDAYERFLEEANNVWTENNLDSPGFPESRTRRKKRMDGEEERDANLDARTAHRREYFATLDAMLCELEQRLKGLDEIFSVFGFLSREKFQRRSNDDINADATKIIQRYPMWFSGALHAQLIGFRDLYFASATYDRMVNGSEYKAYLVFIVENRLLGIFDEVAVLLRISLTLPVSNASCERIMSVLKRIKTYLRTNMQQQRLSDLAFLSVEKEEILSLNIDDLITTFAEMKSRRGARF
jgi:hypothetical protein